MKRLIFWSGIMMGLVIQSQAASLVWELENGPEGGAFPFNATLFRITNTSDAGIGLTNFTLTIGNPEYNFDYLSSFSEQFSGPGSGTATATLITPDRVDEGGVRSDIFEYQFTGFSPGTTFQGQWDIDHDTSGFVADARNVLFNNGAADNALATFQFSDGSQINYVFPDLPVQESYVLSIPEPGTMTLLLGFGVGLFFLRRREAKPTDLFI